MTDAAPLLDLKRISTGHAEADEVLHGGFPEHSINVIMGEPGTGKTILAQQLLFHNAGGDRPVVYLSTLSEPLQKVLTYLQRFGFYEPEKMVDSVVYEDIGEEILERGVSYVFDHVSDLIRERNPRMLVIDSFRAVHDLTTAPDQMRRLSARLGGLLAAYDVTTFLVGEYADADVALFPEFAVADGILQLARRGSEKRDERYLRVLKLRGSGYEEGLHAFEITPQGLKVYPRLVTPPVPRRYSTAVERVETGVEGLDTVLGGGFLRGSTALVLGQGGTGKTTFGLAFALQGVRVGEPSLYLNFQENPTQLAQTIRRMGVDVEEVVGRGLHMMYASPVELKIDAVVVELFRAIRAHGIRRVVIDALGDIRLAALSGERFHDYLYSMVQHFAVSDVTAVLTLEATHDPAQREEEGIGTRLSTLCDALISLGIEMAADPPRRKLRVVKARNIDHQLEPLSFSIRPGGITLDLAGAGA